MSDTTNTDAVQPLDIEAMNADLNKVLTEFQERFPQVRLEVLVKAQRDSISDADKERLGMPQDAEGGIFPLSNADAEDAEAFADVMERLTGERPGDRDEDDDNPISAALRSIFEQIMQTGDDGEEMTTEADHVAMVIIHSQFCDGCRGEFVAAWERANERFEQTGADEAKAKRQPHGITI